MMSDVVTSKEVIISGDKDNIPTEVHDKPFEECKVRVESYSVEVAGSPENEAVDAENGMATDDLTALL